MNMITRSDLITGPGTRPHRVILYSRGHRFDPYVVHYQAEDEGDRWQGTYTGSIATAAAEFERRCKSCGVSDERVTPVPA